MAPVALDRLSRHLPRTRVEQEAVLAQSPRALYEREFTYDVPEETIPGLFLFDDEVIPAHTHTFLHDDEEILESAGALNREKVSRVPSRQMAEQMTPAQRRAFQGSNRREKRNRMVGSLTSDEKLSKNEKQALEAAEQLINNKLIQYAEAGLLSAAGLGALGFAINGAQGDDNGSILVNPLTGALTATAAGGAIGHQLGAIGYAPLTDRVVQSRMRDLGDDKGAEYYAQNKRRIEDIERARMPKELKAKAGRKRTGAVIGAGSGALLSLMQQLRDDTPDSPVIYTTPYM